MIYVGLIGIDFEFYGQIKLQKNYLLSKNWLKKSFGSFMLIILYYNLVFQLKNTYTGMKNFLFLLIN